ncbi:HepT-like ribonuclease domain-containing protein [Bosea psychrotolerans]|uniref:HepT-like ribonuclease domain-containing protein n=1 Tax=Bosea psychrotolerans TaxID=1871628 RepID=UPI0015E19E60|nr:HepT-like ribonuclease domain-containing protein [Bosea psychrotolerans]
MDVVLEDILEAIRLIEEAASAYDSAGFGRALFVQRGIERSLEIISEAVRHVPDDLLALRPEIAWVDVRAIGNLIRHEYWRVDPDIVWTMVTDDLPPLRSAIEDLLRRSRA